MDSLTEDEILHLRALLSSPPFSNTNRTADPMALANSMSTDSEYPHFDKSTHAWAVFADDPRKSATWQDRMVGLLIIAFQLYTYAVFAAEAIDDFHNGFVSVTINHKACVADAYTPDPYHLQCDADFTDNKDALVAFVMLGIFLSGDMIQAIRVLYEAPHGGPKLFASLALLEVSAAFFAACLSVSYNLYKGDVTDAVSAGVGLLFIRELSSKTYTGLRNGKRRQYYEYFGCLLALVSIGMCMDPLCEIFLAHKYDN
jgi:hypothetical protein